MFTSRVCLCAFFAVAVFATVFGNIQGVVHGPDHRPIADARGAKLKDAGAKLILAAHEEHPDLALIHFDAQAFG